MTDNNTFDASAIGGTPGDAPAAEPLPLGGPEWTPESRAISDAHAEIGRLKSDAAFQQLLLKGDEHALAKVQALQRTINSGSKTVIGGENQQEVEQRLSAWQDFAGLDPAVIEQIRSNGSVSKAEYDEAARMKKQFMADRDWARRYFDGGMKERRQMSLVSIILSSPIAVEQK
jgi:hypothetical protein